MIDEEKTVKTTISDSIKIKEKFAEECTESILNISKEISKCLQNNGTIFLFGNGGSAADAQHIAAEFIGRFSKERQALPAEALTTNTSILTAIANDYDFSTIFSRQVRAKVKTGDVVVGISTSGKSENVLNGIKEAKSIGAITVGFTGNNTNELSTLVDICLNVPTQNTQRIQEVHILAWHIICDLVEKTLF